MSYNDALRLSYREVCQTCPEVEEAFAEAEARVKKCTESLREALVKSIQRVLELEYRERELEGELASLLREVDSLRGEIDKLETQVSSLKTDIEILEERLHEE